MITIKHTDELDNLVTEQQLDELKNYYKLIYINNILKKKELYKNKTLFTIDYYLDTGETESQAITIIQSSYPSIPFGIIEKSSHGTYNIEKERFFLDSGVFEDFDVETLFDDQGRIICEIETTHESPENDIETKKFIYDYEGYDELECTYDGDGNIEGVSGYGSPFASEYDIAPVSDFPMFFPNFITDNPYYTGDTFLPPVV